MDWWNVSVFGVIPILAIVIMFCFKQKLFWTAPLLSTVLATIISLIAMPTIVGGGEASDMFFKLVVPLHFLISAILTAIAYGITLLLKKKH